MKRTILRIIVLAGVVALGVFAIAQAQRAVQDKPAAGAVPDNPLRAAEGDGTGGAVEASSNPLRGSADRAAPPETAVPRRLPPSERATPLTATDPLVAGNPLRKAASDPFGSRGLRNDNPVRPTGGEATGDPGRAAEPASRFNDPPASPQSQGSRFPQSSGPGLGNPNTVGEAAVVEGQSPVAGLPANPVEATGRNLTLPPGGYRYTLAPVGGNRPASPRPEDATGSRTAPTDREPAPFNADPAATPASPVRVIDPARSEAASPGDDSLQADNGAATEEGAGTPGSKQIEGPQSPQLVVQKLAPAEIQVGKAAVFRVVVRNTGQATAGNAEIRDQIPRGTRLLGTNPRASRGPRGELVWNLGAIRPGEEAAVEMQVMPTAEGEIGSVATVQFNADASARTRSTRPKLVVETTGAARVSIGEEVSLTFTVSNPGTGVATGVVLQEHIPPSLKHPAGSELEYPVGNLKPGESRKLDLKLVASRPGPVTNVLAARADGNLRTEHRFDLEVVAPQLDVSVAGPKRRYLERPATYQVSIANPGSAPAQQVELVAYLPSGLKFLSANNSGYYDQTNRAVHWRLEELPTNEKGTVELVAMPVEAGQQSIKVRASAQKGLTAEKEQPVVIEGIAAVFFRVASDRNPIEVGGETTYEIVVANQGSKVAGNVRVAMLLPPEMKALSAEGPSRYAADATRVVFEPVSRLEPKTDSVYRVRLQGLRAGDLRVRCQLSTDEMQTPVTKEESIRVYADE